MAAVLRILAGMTDAAAAIDLTSDPVLVRVIGAVEAEVDGERILLSPRDFAYFGLAGAGVPVWDRIDGTRRLSEIVQALESEFAAEPGVIDRETRTFVQALAAAGLVAAR